MCAPRGALRHPPLEQIDLRDRELFFRIQRRHHLVLVLRGDAEDEFAFLQLARRHDGNPFALPEDALVRVEPEFGFPFAVVRPVTAQAILREDRQDIAAEIDGGGRRRVALAHDRTQREHKDAGQRVGGGEWQHETGGK